MFFTSAMSDRRRPETYVILYVDVNIQKTSDV